MIRLDEDDPSAAFRRDALQLGDQGGGDAAAAMAPGYARS
jgi:hypothetical protein